MGFSGGRSPHRSQRAELQHWALISGCSNNALQRPALTMRARRSHSSATRSIHAQLNRRSDRNQRSVTSVLNTSSVSTSSIVSVRQRHLESRVDHRCAGMRIELYALHRGQRICRSLWVAPSGWSVTDSGPAKHRGQRTRALGSVPRTFPASIHRLDSSFILSLATDVATTPRSG